MLSRPGPLELISSNRCFPALRLAARVRTVGTGCAPNAGSDETALGRLSARRSPSGFLFLLRAKYERRGAKCALGAVESEGMARQHLYTPSCRVTRRQSGHETTTDRRVGAAIRVCSESSRRHDAWNACSQLSTVASSSNIGERHIEQGSARARGAGGGGGSARGGARGGAWCRGAGARGARRSAGDASEASDNASLSSSSRVVTCEAGHVLRPRFEGVGPPRLRRGSSADGSPRPRLRPLSSADESRRRRGFD